MPERTENNPLPESSSKHNDKIWREQIRRVEKNAALSNVISIIVALVLAAELWQENPGGLILPWLIYMGSISAIRAAMDIMHSRSDKYELIHDAYGYAYLVLILLTALGWGASGYLLFPVEPAHQLVLGFVLAGIASGGVTVMASMRKLYNVYLILVVSPLAINFALMGAEFTVLACVIAGYIGVMIMIGARINTGILSSLEMRFHNESLIKFMSQARNDSEDLNEELATEIEQRKRIEKELKKSRQEAEAANKAKSEFLANMSHEIRTPMNGILGTLQLLQDSELNNSQSEYVNIAHNSGEALLSLLNDILDFSKIEAGKLELESIPFDIKGLVKEINVLLRKRAEERQVELTSEIESEVPNIIKGDSVRIRQVLSNLITNAIKFTEKGKVTVKIKVLEKTQKMARLRIEVNDTGIGIAEKAQKKLFNSFTQADGTTTRKYGGTGLGLAIVRQLVTLMRGRLGIDSEEGKGSSFWVEIGFEMPEDELEIPVKNEKNKTEIADNLQGHILLVEDNPVNQIVAKKMLEKIGLSYEVANNGEEAINILKQSHEINLVLMDCQMPVMDGYTATQVLREYEKKSGARRLPVVAMTANAMEGDKEKCLSAGMDDYVAKPVKLVSLKEALGRWL
ncbi:BarA sensory histidine kinase (= VarS = GacS) [hydrothermal vent metagenome]|uniref:histidine kinase n=1 Tax=hydrothermal vent metagenome TaxID=652676 RepID=A0A3B0Y605_9ZZZZ